MDRTELKNVVLEKLAESNKDSGETEVATQEVETETEVVDETKANEEVKAESEAKPEKKTGLQKRLDKLHREKMEAIERATLLEEQLEKAKAVKEPSKESDGELELDDASKQYLERVVKGLLESQLKEKEELTFKQKVVEEKKSYTKEFESKLLESFANDFDEDTGFFSDASITKMQALNEQFEANPKWWLDAINEYGVETAHTLATLGKMTPSVKPKQDSVDKILEKERLTKTVNPSSSNVTEKVQKREGENKKSFLNRIIMDAVKKT